MFGHYTYLIYTLLIAFPLTALEWIYYWPLIKTQLKRIGLLIGVFTLYTGILWIYALHIKIWWYSPEKILNIKVFGTVLEDSVWWISILLLQIPCILILMQKLDRKESVLKRN